MKKTVLACALAALLALPVLANDSTAELAAGGLVLTKTDAIEMRSEDLLISAEAVQVRYVFVNTSGAPVTTRVAFPMPDIGGEYFFESDTAIPDREDPANILDFRTTVDGKPVAMAVEQRAIAGGVDRSAWLQAHGIPLALHLDGVGARLDALPRAAQEEAMRLGLVTPEEFDQGKGWEKHLTPAWILKTTFHWEQTFPAGTEVVVEHHYRPAVGGSVGTMVGAKEVTYGDFMTMMNRYCVDSALLAAIEKASKGADYPPFTETRIAYVLKTGGNWAKPIGDFRLVIDKGSTANLVSFCASGVKKIAPTRFEVRKTNWRPEKDLDILILKPLPPMDDAE
ncbi:MAG: DUF4424 domain-containing protein [Caulobacter sp.]|nr:DUF4424 domain-containing protein [Caulobacter sp.]